MIAFWNEWGWWAVPAALAAGAGVYWWRLRRGGNGGPKPGELFLTVEDARRALNEGERLVFVDVRSETAYNSSATTISGAIRLHPGRAVEEARALSIPPGSRIVTFCA